MKKYILSGFFLLLITTLNAQDIISDFMSEKNNVSECVNISLSGKMLRMSVANDPSADKDFKKLVNDIDNIKLASNISIDSDDRKRLAKLMQSYEELMVVSESEQKISMYTKENKGKITEFVLCIESDDTLVLMVIMGNIDIKQLSKLAKSFKISGMEHLEKLDN